MKSRIYGACVALCLASAAAAAATPSFFSIELRSLAGSTGNVTATGVNRYGDVVGTSGGLPFVYHYRSGSVMQLGGLTGTLSVFGINDYGQMVGEQISPLGINGVQWTASGGALELPSYGLDYAVAIGNNGDVAGNAASEHLNNFAVKWVGPTHQPQGIGVLWEFPFPPGYGTSTANAINNLGHVTGVSDAGEGFDPNTAQSFGVHAFLYKGPGNDADLGALALTGNGSDYSEGSGVNDHDEVVGISNTAIPARNSANQACSTCGVAAHAFWWRAGKMRDLGNLANIPGWDSEARSINNVDQIVGWSDSIVNGQSTHRAFLYVNGQMLNLQFYIYGRDPNVRLTEAVGITCAGWIVANGFNVNSPNVSRAYLLIPRGPTNYTGCVTP